MTREKAIALLSMIEFEQAECCLNTWYKGIDDDMEEALDMAIQAIKQTRWIPVKERLPKPYQPILVTSNAFYWGKGSGRYFVKQINFGGVVDFIAWMPLPEPYKGESEE